VVDKELRSAQLYYDWALFRQMLAAGGEQLHRLHFTANRTHQRLSLHDKRVNFALLIMKSKFVLAQHRRRVRKLGGFLMGGRVLRFHQRVSRLQGFKKRKVPRYYRKVQDLHFYHHPNNNYHQG
jgi:hypothetical protein